MLSSLLPSSITFLPPSLSLMEQKMLLTLFIWLLPSAVLSTGKGFEEIKEEGGKAKLLFVFGDSYADTGNLPVSVSRSWKAPYGVTFPGKPAGRFSDGRVLTDYIASFIGVRPPLAYQWMKNLKRKSVVENGINFAHGGTGVFQTLVDEPNMTTQIDYFQQLIDQNVFGSRDFSSSIALVSLAGNDYAAFLAKNGTIQGLTEFTRSVIKQLMVNIRRINRFGIKKIIVTGVGPIGCLPQNTISHENCNEALNNFSMSHNQLLQQNILELNYEVDAPVFIYLDLYSAFISALGLHQSSPGDVSNKLKPCCVGDCGSVDEKGKEKYAVCENPSRSIFWDSIHPSNSGWKAVCSALNKSLHFSLL